MSDTFRTITVFKDGSVGVTDERGVTVEGRFFGFTREDVRILRVAAQAYEEDPFYFRDLEPEEDVDESPVPGMYRALAARIESLLPPEK